ncbi:acyl-CoA carboxylase subunit epsilon [Rhodococcus opacus]|uniref:Acyl-CoA carboxylase subunit epsilon n=1 Tax=Rhodococcus opacus TaxID=37919 RepID=A0A2S8I8T6_RHOOP|nr:acyl-CoA carboxylase subunit epsilon [Rhodococcus opacus]PQP11193.1 acyl-CoA carboxylase subunit epsilon [Rhodococcus opacus]
MTAITDDDVRTETGSDATASVNGSAADTTLAEGAATDLPGDTDGTAAGAAREPFLKVVKGSPSDEEIAALVAVLSSVAAGSGEPDSHVPPESWGAPTRMHRSVAPFSPYAFPNVSAYRR